MPEVRGAHDLIRMLNHNKRGKGDNVNLQRTADIAVGNAHDQRVAFATAPGKRHDC
ncbi:MAG TPA: hypothetical protein VEX37_14380 [Thermomicrobiales bacterium]|nr:hypothetical protein [Thermomicrobiales bacterium]